MKPHYAILFGATLAASAALIALAPPHNPKGVLPDSNLTHGAINTSITQENINQTICNPNWHGINPYTHLDAHGTAQERPPSSYTSWLKRFQLGLGGDNT